ANLTFRNISLKTAVFIAPQPPILGEHELKVTHLLPLCKQILISPTVSELGDLGGFNKTK
ncbi:hypothetical protein, partial [Moorena sp. SIO4E2]|uniref:hypothetical protein n=1 Tax=Moorena sp. SIO4E2 TaxID=2607826 RepID=UPI00257DEDB0